MPKWEQDPLVAQPQVRGRWEQDSLVTEQAESLIKRFGKQLYNYLAQIPIGITKTAMRFAPGEVEQMIETRKKLGVPIEKKRPIPLMPVSPPETWKEKGIDIAAGITGTVAQIAALRKGLPAGTPEPVVWEMQNLMTGGKPGMGALYGGVVAGAGRLPASELAKATAESAGFYSLARIEGAEPGEALTRAAIPVALRGAGALYRTARARPGVVEPQVITRGITKEARIAREVAGIRRLGKLPPATLESTTAKVSKWSETAKVLRKTEVKKALHELRKEQAGRGAEITERAISRGDPTWTAISKGKAGYKGKAAVPEVTPLSLTPAEREVLAKRVIELYPTTAQQFKRTNTITALDKMVNGKVPANFEFELLEPVLGVQQTVALYQRLVPAPSLTMWDIPRVIWQSLKFVVGFDVQTARQLSSYAALEPKIYGKSVGIASKAYVKAGYAKEQIARVAKDPQHSEAIKHGVNFYGYKPYGKFKPGTRPEWVMGQIPEKMVKIGLKRGRLLKTLLAPMRLYGKWLSAAERSNIAGVNTGQQALWNKGSEQIKLLAKSPKELDRSLKNYAKTLNTYSKILQAKTPSGREIQSAAQWILFSPSMTAARPLAFKAIIANKGSRPYAAQLLATNVAKIATLSAITSFVGKALGKDVDSDINPLSSDWGKIRVGDTRFDIMGGDAQFYRTLARLAVGAYVNTVGEGFPTKVGKWRVQTPQDIITTYGETRETAAINFFRQLFTGRDFFGEEIPRWEAFIRGWTPQMATDFYDALARDGTIVALLASAAATMSAGVMTYPESAWQKEQEFKDKISQTAHKQDWEDLNSTQQRVLRMKNRTQFKEFELEKKQERKLRPAEISLEEQRKAGQWIQKQLSKTHQNIIDESGVSMNISRTIGDWWLNDKRYKQYRNLTAFYLAQELNKLERNPAWIARRDSRFVQMAVNIARLKARMRVRKIK